MKHQKLWIIVVSLAVFIVLGFSIPRLIPHASGLTELQQKEVLAETSVAFDAPLLEVASMPAYRIREIQGTTVTVGVYGWFGWHVANVRFTDCWDQVGFINPNFGCQGGVVDYIWPDI